MTQTRTYRALVALVAALVVLSTAAPVLAVPEGEPNDSLVEATAISSGERVDGTVADADDEDWFAIPVQRGQTISAELTIGSQGERLSFNLYDAREDNVDGGRADPASRTLAGDTVERDGNYYVRVAPYFGTSGDYSLEVTVADTDSFEPNEVAFDAVPYTVGDTQSGEITQSDVDWFSFEATRGDIVTVEATIPSTGERLSVGLYDPDEDSLDSGRADPGEVSVRGDTIETTGTHYVRVANYFGTTGPYSFTVTIERTDDFEPNEILFDATPITVGETVSAEISQDDIDWFSFEATRGQHIFADVTIPSESQGGDSLGVTIYDADEQSLDNGRADPGETSRRAHTVEVNGTYYVRVANYFGTTSEYELVVRTVVIDEFEPNERAVDSSMLFENPRNDTFTGEIVRSDEDWFDVPAETGQTVRLTFTAPADGDTLSAGLWAPDSTRAENESRVRAGETVTLTYTAEETGDHLVRVAPYFSGIGPYSFELTVDGEPYAAANDRFEYNENRAQAAAITPGTYGDLRIVDDDVDVFAVDLEAGRPVEATITYDNASDDLSFVVTDPNVAEVIRSETGSGEESVTFLAETTGTHYFAVEGVSGGNTGYDLSIRVPTNVSVSLAPASPTVAPNETTTVDVRVDGVDAGVGAYDLTVGVDDPARATITAVESLGGGALTTAYGADNASVTVTGSGVDTADEGRASVLRVTLLAGAGTGQTPLTVDVTGVDDEAGLGYFVEAVAGATLTVSSGPGDVTGDGRPANDLDGDGRFEDVNGDGQGDFDDAIDLAFIRGADADPAYFDFDGDGDVDFDDAIELAFSV